MNTQIFHQRVSVTLRDGIADVRMVRADKHNALDWDMFCGLVAAAKSLRKDRTLRAVILSGEGPSFCSGLDVPAFAKTPGKGLRMFLKYGIFNTNLAQEVAWCWRRLPVPVIAVVHGRCYGGGLQLALACDFRFARPDAEMSVMEVKWGLVPDMTGSVTLRELLPIDQAKLLAMTGRTFTGVEAMAMNLVTDVSDDPLAAAEALIAEIKTRSPDAVAGVKALFQSTWTASVRRAFAVETRLQWRMFFSRNQRVAVKAGMAKKAPEFGPRQFGG
jgi:enoyl-CoA hydratase/carnithine racemase